MSNRAGSSTDDKETRIFWRNCNTALILSFKSLYARATGWRLDLREAKKLEPAEAAQLYTHPAHQLIAQEQAKQMESLRESIQKIEKAVLSCAREIPLYAQLLTLPGIGRIWGMTIPMEVGDVRPLPNGWTFCQLLPVGRRAALKQRQTKGGE